jgi:hypothetical protein
MNPFSLYSAYQEASSSELGVDTLKPARWLCSGVKPKALKKEFEVHPFFHVRIDNQKFLPFGSREEVPGRGVGLH